LPAYRDPSDLEVTAALGELQQELTSSELADLITLEQVPPPEVVQHALKPVLESVKKRAPAFDVSRRFRGRWIPSRRRLPNDPYVAVDSTSNRVVIAVNMRHPYIQELSGSEGVLNYLRHCMYHAIAEWQARRKTTSLDPDTIRILKDLLLRLPSKSMDAVMRILRVLP
jgi:hypothetical protein